MTRNELISIAQKAGFTVEAGKRAGVLIVEGDGGLCESTLRKFAELIAARCAAGARRMNAPAVAGVISGGMK